MPLEVVLMTYGHHGHGAEPVPAEPAAPPPPAVTDIDDPTGGPYGAGFPGTGL